MLKSYLKDEEKAGLDENCILLAESQAADEAGDVATAWAWLQLAELPAPALLAAKRTNGAEWIRRHGLRTETAEAAYGKDWLDRNI